MKHTVKVTIYLVTFFFLAQVMGLLVVNHYIDHKVSAETNTPVFQPLPYNIERPEVENQSTSFIYITIAIIVGTLFILLIMKLNKPFIWKFWFFFTIFLTLAIAFAAFMDNIIAAALAFVLAFLKIKKPTLIIQNFTEIFIYGGLAAIFVPIINLFAVFMLLLVISIYDFIAVFKTKHMVKMAKFQSKSEIFAGLLIPYGQKSSPGTKVSLKAPSAPKRSHSRQEKRSVAVLGGGDIGFTLIFAGVVMKELMLVETVLVGFLKTLIIPVAVTIALILLLVKGQKNKFYPAMPFLSAGCVVGYLIVSLL
jgi:presenilin-like A22 family membrane protease